jgi:hypothetical protein
LRKKKRWSGERKIASVSLSSNYAVAEVTIEGWEAMGRHLQAFRLGRGSRAPSENTGCGGHGGKDSPSTLISFSHLEERLARASLSRSTVAEGS